MKHTIILFIAVMAVGMTAFAAAALGGTGSASASGASKGALVALRTTALGSILVNASGRTLYLFDKDKRARSACYGGCAAYWPPLLSSAKPRAGKGVRASLLGLTRRADGKRQVTYAGHPLYLFFTDTKAGQTTGQGRTDFGAAWEAVTANGRGIESTASGSSGTGGGYGGGYGG
jgi:predicted lipoprotein with Yx(FWY)xxD motif